MERQEIREAFLEKYWEENNIDDSFLNNDKYDKNNIAYVKYLEDKLIEFDKFFNTFRKLWNTKEENDAWKHL